MRPSPVLSADAAAWAAAREQLLPDIHAVDRHAVRIWCQFYPLPMADAFRDTPDREGLTRQLRLRGGHDLATHVDRSHWFLYVHRFWPATRAAIVSRMESAPAADAIESTTRTIADDVAAWV